MIPSIDELENIYEIVKNQVHRTPVLSSSIIDSLANATLHFKCENFQKMGAFKMRGAVAAISKIKREKLKYGVSTHSSGNFAQAVSLSAKINRIPAYIVMPKNAPQVKKDAVKGYGGIIFESGNTLKDREEKLREVVDKYNCTFIHPSNELTVIMGQGTAAIELIEEQPDLDIIITPVGGGGLLAGTALAGQYYSPKTEIWGAEPSGADDAYRSLISGHIIPVENPQTIADGLRTSLGDQNFPIIKEFVKKIILVDDAEIIEAMKMIYQYMKIIVEPSSAITLAAILKSKAELENKNIGIIISGGNVDLGTLPFK